VCSDEFSLAVTYSNAATAQRINSHLITILMEEAIRLQRESNEISRQPSTQVAPGIDSIPVVAERQGQLRAAVEGIDGGNIPGRNSPHNPLVALQLRGLPSGVTQGQDARSPMPRGDFFALPPGMPKSEESPARVLPQLVIIAPAELPNAPISPNTLVVGSAGVIMGLSVGAMASLRRTSRLRP
jgi:hypothetical protein